MLQELKQATQVASSPDERYDQWELDFLADYIVNQYHTYTKSMLLQVRDFADKVAEVHGDRHPETRLIAQKWRKLGEEMTAHMQKEETMLFPHIKRLVQGEKDSQPPASPPFGAAQQLIGEVEAEHEAVGNSLAEIETLSQGFTPPQESTR